MRKRKGSQKKISNSAVKTSLDYIKRVKLYQKTSEFPKAIKLLSSNIALRNKYNYRPQSFKELSANKRIVITPPDVEILWLSYLIREHSSNLALYVNYKSKYEKLVLRGDFDSALEILNSIKIKCGYSIWLIEALFFCNQQLAGLEGNKKLLNEIFENANSEGEFNWICYIAYLISERNEDINDFDFIRYKHSRTLDDLPDGEFKEALLSVQNFYIFDYINFTEENLKALFSICQTFSIIDIYNCVLRVLAENQFNKFFSNVSAVLSTFPNIQDPKLNRLKLLNSESSYFNENYLEISDTFDNVEYLQPVILNPLFKLGKVPISSNKFIGTYLKHINNIFIKENNFEESVQYINYLALNLKHIDQSYGLVLTPKELLEGFNNYINTGLNFIYSPFLKDEDQFIMQFNESISDSDLSALSEIENMGVNINFSDESGAKNLPYNSEYCFLKYHKLKVKQLLDTDNKDKAISIISNLLVINPLNVYFYNLPSLCNGTTWKEYKSMGIFADILVVLDSYLSIYNDDKQLFNLTACLRTFLKECGKSKPSELNISDFKGDAIKYSHFLRKVCSSFNLSQDSYSFDHPREIVVERLAICEKLKEIKEAPSVTEEIEELERKLAITDGLQEVDNAGLNVDQLRFFKESKNKYHKTFERYKALKALTALPMFKNMAVFPDENSLFKSTYQESISLMSTMLLELSDMFLKNEEFGLDYYLSMRIRHGRFMGVTRGPFERNKLVTKFSSELNGYLDNVYWNNKLEKDLNSEQIDELNKILAKFSSAIDEYLTTFKDNYIQIYSEEKKLGLFNINITMNDVLLANSFVKEETTLDEFLEYVMELFVANLEQCSSYMKRMLSSQLLQNINNKTHQLQTNVSLLLKSSTDKELNTKIIDTRTEMNNVLNEISGWFNISGENKKFNRSYTFNNIVDIALSKTKRVHTNFSPIIEINNKSTIEFHSNLLGILVDAFDILFSNIQQHGKQTTPQVQIELNEEKLSFKQSKIIINVKNPVQEKDVDFDKLDTIRDEIDSKKLKTKEEDGSGFHKLFALPYVDSKEDIVFGYKNGQFRVEIAFTLTLA